MGVVRLKLLRAVISDEVLRDIDEFAGTVIAERYSPLLEGALRHQAKALAVDPGLLMPSGPERDPVPGYRTEAAIYAEIFPTDHGLVAIEVDRVPGGVYLSEADQQPRTREPHLRLTLYGIGTEQVAEPLREIGDLFKERFDISIEEYRYSSPAFRKFKEEGDRKQPEEPSAEDRASARLLQDDVVRRAAIAIASAGGLLRRDLPQHLGDSGERSEEIERRLSESPLAEIDLVVTCKRRSTEVARAPSREALEEMAKGGLKCACGRSVMDERIDEAVSLTDHGRRMLNGSYWMTILLIEELRELGIGLDEMLVEEIAGGDEMDFLADITGALALFELKDKEFSLGNAYSFGSKATILDPQLPVVVTSATVGNDAKEHFKQAAKARQPRPYYDVDQVSPGGEIKYIEGMANLKSELETLVGGVYEEDAIDVLRRLTPAAAASGNSLLDAVKRAAIGDEGAPSATASEARAGS